MAIYIKICKTLKDSKLTDKLSGTEKDFNILMNAETELVMKIGYTRDDDSTIFSRDQAYRTENPNIIHYKLIKGPTKVEETKLHILFKKDKLKRKGREWFKVTEENFKIISGFNTKEDIYNRVSSIKAPQQRFRVDHYLLRYVYSKISETEKDVVKLQDRYVEIYKKLLYLEEDYHITYICSLFSVQFSDIQKFIDQYKTRISNLQENLSPIIRDRLSEFNNLTNTVDRFKLLVGLSESPGIDDNDMKSFLDLVPEKYGDYYYTLGPDRIRANSYQESLLRGEWIKKSTEPITPDGVKDEIYSYFTMGGRFSKAKIKDMLKDIYKRYEFKQTAKASDLGVYFVIKPVKIREDNRWINGFEIIAKK